MSARGLKRAFADPGGGVVEAVRDVSLTVARGETVLVLGPSGTGKTTLLSMVGCILAPDAGELEVCGTDVRSLGPSELPGFRLRHLGFVFQTFRLLDGLTATENVELPLHMAGWPRAESWSRARDLLDELDVGRRAGARAGALSAGERQRVAVARALALDPPLLLADEPTGSLDSAAGVRVMDLLGGAARRREAGLLVVSHDERVRSVADRVLAMSDGSLGAPT